MGGHELRAIGDERRCCEDGGATMAAAAWLHMGQNRVGDGGTQPIKNTGLGTPPASWVLRSQTPRSWATPKCCPLCGKMLMALRVSPMGGPWFRTAGLAHYSPFQIHLLLGRYPPALTVNPGLMVPPHRELVTSRHGDSGTAVRASGATCCQLAGGRSWVGHVLSCGPRGGPCPSPLTCPLSLRRLLITVELQFPRVRAELQRPSQLLPVLTGRLRQKRRPQHELPVQIKPRGVKICTFCTYPTPL